MSYSTESADEVLLQLHASREGLNDEDVATLLKKHGFNEIPEKRRSILLLFLRQFNDILIYILLGALGLSTVLPLLDADTVTMRSFLDAFAILAILLLNAVLGFIQEYKAENAIRELKKLTAPHAHVRRGGKLRIIPSRELLPGDIVILETGDRMSADGRLIAASHLEINESSLTGESQPVGKDIKPLDREPSVADRRCMAFSGTLVTRGSGECVVTATGLRTQIGRIASLVQETRTPETPLERRLRNLGKILGAVVACLCISVVAIGILKGLSFFHIILVGTSLAVSAVPEGLPAVVTVCFAIGVRKMAKNHALVRRLESLETLGSVTVICSDKTGTMTENRMSVVETWLDPAFRDEQLLAIIGASCNRAELPDLGDPTELALLEFAKRRGVERLPIDEEEVPFTSEEKYMQTKHGMKSFLKGAPEILVRLCGEIDIENVLRHNREMAAKGLRVLACAIRENGNCRFIGLVGMEDPPREEVKEAVALAASAGIRTIMITGDNAETARSIAIKVGVTGEAVTGEDLERMSPEELSEKVRSLSIFARVSPLHKIRILQALQHNHEVVAMTGDGVNDAPALKGAHVGIAMGGTGTDVAREAASIILADDHYATIVGAIQEGRRIYDNIRKFVLFLLRANFDELLLVTSALLLDLPLPYLPLHILWINLMTDSLPALALGMEPAERDIMRRPPRPLSEHILSGEWSRLIVTTLWAFGMAFGFFTWQLRSGIPLPEARTATLMLAITFELFLALGTRSRRPIWQIGLFSNRWMIGAVAIPFALQFFLLYTPLRTIFNITPFGLSQWGVILLLASSGFFFFELLKLRSPQKE